MLASRLAVEDLVEELIAAQADVGARDKRGMDLERLMCHREVEQIGYEIKCKKKKKKGSSRGATASWEIPSPPALLSGW